MLNMKVIVSYSKINCFIFNAFHIWSIAFFVYISQTENTVALKNLS